jgi:hypothetical protein
MRFPASGKLEIIRLVEQSHLPIKRTLDKLGISRPRFYRWYDQCRRLAKHALQIAARALAKSGTGSPTRLARSFRTIRTNSA